MQLLYAYDQTSVQRDDNYYHLSQGQPGTKGTSRTITCSVLPTGWLRTRNLQRQSVHQYCFSLFLWLVCHVLGTKPWKSWKGTLFIFHQPLLKTSKQLFTMSFLFPIYNLDKHHHTRYMHVVTQRFQCWKDARDHLFLLIGESWSR